MSSEITALLSCESKKEKVEKSSTSNGTAKRKTNQVRLKKRKIITTANPRKVVTRCGSEMYVSSFCSKNNGIYTGNYIVLIHKKIHCIYMII